MNALKNTFKSSTLVFPTTWSYEIQHSTTRGPMKSSTLVWIIVLASVLKSRSQSCTLFYTSTLIKILSFTSK